jgi:hypothetical protein
MPVVLSGVDELKRALKKYAPDLRKEMDAKIKGELKSVIDEARSRVPGSVPGGLYGWQNKGSEGFSPIPGQNRPFPKYNPMIIRKGLVYRAGTSKTQPTGFAALFSLWNSSAAGSIIEVAGRRNSYGRKQVGNKGQGNKNQVGRSNNPNAGARFVGAMNDIGALRPYESSTASKERSTGRLLYATYADRQGKTLDAVMKAIELAQRKFNERAKPTQSKAVA